MEPSSSKEAASESFLPDGVIEVRRGDLGSLLPVFTPAGTRTSTQHAGPRVWAVSPIAKGTLRCGAAGAGRQPVRVRRPVRQVRGSDGTGAGCWIHGGCMEPGRPVTSMRSQAGARGGAQQHLHAACRNVNKRWREVLTPLVRVAIVSPRHWAEQPRAKSEKLVRTFAGIETLQVSGPRALCTQ